MRRATIDTGWLQLQENTASSPAVQGFSLGYDFAAEHEWGTPYLKAALGIEQKAFPLGVEDRTMTQVPAALRFVSYELRSKDRRVKRTMPAALLFCNDHAAHLHTQGATGAELAQALDAGFWYDFADKRGPQTDAYQIVSSWSSQDGFAIHVRGAENVARLQALHEAFLRKDISLADAAIVGFARKSLTLVVNSTVPDEMRAQVRANDEAHLRLHQAVKATGIEDELKAKGLGWYALSPAWENAEGSALLFFLNPKNQKEHAHGWFTLDELRAWALGQGPVVEGPKVLEHLNQRRPHWDSHLTSGLLSAGVKLRRHPVYQWLDPEHTQPGVRLLTLPGDSLASGVHSAIELERYLPEPSSAAA